MYHYDPATALEELDEEAVLPNPVHLRDMMLRAHLDASHSLEYNRIFVEYQKKFGEVQQLGGSCSTSWAKGKQAWAPYHQSTPAPGGLFESLAIVRIHLSVRHHGRRRRGPSGFLP